MVKWTEQSCFFCCLFIHMCIHCLGHLSILPPPSSPSLSHPPRFQVNRAF
jgi:hypothetical protein